MNRDTINTRRSEMRTDKNDKLADQYHLAALLSRRAPKDAPPYQAAYDAAMIYRAAKSIAALAVASCNYGLSKRQETRRENLAKVCEEVAAWYGLKASCSGDPRGYVVRLNGPDVPRTGWGDGFGVA